MKSKNGPVITIPVPGAKDASGAYIPESTEEISIDSLMTDGLIALRGVIKSCKREAANCTPSRESVQNLKDAMTMLHQLKEKETEILDSLSDEELEEMLTKRAKKS